ncbi:hypothetical protein LC048_16175 [Mesobacillus subterraneus]|nr:hypothetical protein [Mesobacillus subterraneus]WLR54020.1 hypothetical protein LC048_16175 [Mesobacillus subterraneus]
MDIQVILLNGQKLMDSLFNIEITAAFTAVISLSSVIIKAGG